MSTATFVERLGAVRLNRFHWKLLVVSGLGWLFDAMDVVLIAFLLAPISREFALDPAGTGLAVSAGLRRVVPRRGAAGALQRLPAPRAARVPPLPGLARDAERGRRGRPAGRARGRGASHHRGPSGRSA